MKVVSLLANGYERESGESYVCMVYGRKEFSLCIHTVIL